MRLPTTSEQWQTQLAEVPTLRADYAALLDRPENRYLRPLIQPGLRVLEAGSGNGRYVFAFAQRGAWACGIDFCAELVEKVRSQAEALRLSDVTLVHGDILTMPFAEAAFDVYTSFGVYEHFTRRQHAMLLAEARRVLKPGGLLYLEVPQFWSVWTLRRQLRYWVRHLVPPPLVWQRNLSRRYLRACAERAGFSTLGAHVFDAWSGWSKGLSLEVPRLFGLPNPFHLARPFFVKLAALCERQGWLGHTLVYVGRKPTHSTSAAPKVCAEQATLAPKPVNGQAPSASQATSAGAPEGGDLSNGHFP